MTELLQIYKCNVCSNVVEVLHPGYGELVCCGQPMMLYNENTVEASLGKHVPVIEKTEDGKIRIKVGSEPHPMEEEHYIELIEAISPDKKYLKRKYLQPHEEPVMEFKCDCDKIIARELCNIHGLWRNEND